MTPYLRHFHVVFDVASCLLNHSIEAIEVCVRAYRITYVIVWAIKTLNWLLAANKLHKHRGHVALRSGPTVHSLYCDIMMQSPGLQRLLENKSVASLIVKTCYPRACRRLFQQGQQAVTCLQMTSCNKPDFNRLDAIY